MAKSLGEGSQKRSLEQLLEEALGQYSPARPDQHRALGRAMRTVATCLARAKSTPSVLDRAAVMKAAIAYLEPEDGKEAHSQKGTIVLATVKGDVHVISARTWWTSSSRTMDSRSINLGIKQPGDVIIRAAQEHNADAIGLSGLLVKSTLEMKYVIQDLERQKLEYPVICGGAALTRKYRGRRSSAPVFACRVLRRRRLRRAARDGETWPPPMGRARRDCRKERRSKNIREPRPSIKRPARFLPNAVRW